MLVESKTDLCVCGHDRQDHPHLLGTEVKYPCLKCTCPGFSAR